jgi:hypothetical protein
VTIKERLISLVGFSPSANVIDGALVDSGLDGSDTYESTDLLTLKGIAKQLIEVLLTTPDTTNENGYAIKYDRSAALKRLEDLEEELNPTAGPIISSVSPW